MEDLTTSRIIVPAELRIESIDEDALPEDWFAFTAYAKCQQLGDAWLDKGSSALLKVPSAVVPLEYTYLLNPAHPDFTRITLKATADLVFGEGNTCLDRILIIHGELTGR